jgi:hypothetical protein
MGTVASGLVALGRREKDEEHQRLVQVACAYTCMPHHCTHDQNVCVKAHVRARR